MDDGRTLNRRSFLQLVAAAPLAAVGVTRSTPEFFFSKFAPAWHVLERQQWRYQRVVRTGLPSPGCRPLNKGVTPARSMAKRQVSVDGLVWRDA